MWIPVALTAILSSTIAIHEDVRNLSCEFSALQNGELKKDKEHNDTIFKVNNRIDDSEDEDEGAEEKWSLIKINRTSGHLIVSINHKERRSSTNFTITLADNKTWSDVEDGKRVDARVACSSGKAFFNELFQYRTSFLLPQSYKLIDAKFNLGKENWYFNNKKLFLEARHIISAELAPKTASIWF